MKYTKNKFNLPHFTVATYKNVKNYVMRARYIFDLILVDIPSSLIFSVKNRQVGWGVYGQNPLSVTKVIH